ncbi:class I SAM-dependent DNA methyltransferase [Rhodococcus sp. NPDC003318]|uniref:class I SAM-dependent DNA methyltransferase n=1 Tax=Rhodococcus sp. NPDC003318 TaxID=3364503 RepID=UPI00368C1841
MTRWERERGEDASRAYVARFEELAASGTDLHGEARMVDAVLARGSWVLDAGCGTGRVGAELARRGHRVTGVDLDPILLDAARATGLLTVVRSDLAELDLPGERFDAVVAAGNVMIFLEPGTEAAVCRRLARHLAPGGVLIAGFATDHTYTVDRFDRDLTAAGLEVEHRFATWDLRPWRADAPWAVTVARAG